MRNEPGQTWAGTGRGFRNARIPHQLHGCPSVPLCGKSRVNEPRRGAALDFPQFPPFRSLARREAEEKSESLPSLYSLYGGNRSTTYLNRKVIPPPVPPRGEARSEKQKGWHPGEINFHSIVICKPGDSRRLFGVPFILWHSVMLSSIR